MPYNHSLGSQSEVGFISILNPFLMSYIKLCCHSKWGPSRWVGSAGSSETHLISRMENEMFRGVLTNCCIFCNRMRSCEKLLQEERGGRCCAFSLPVFYKQNKRRHIKLINYGITDKKRRLCRVLRASFFALMLTATFSNSPLVRFSRTIFFSTSVFRKMVEVSILCPVYKQAGIYV